MAGHMVKIEGEVPTLDELEAALAHAPDAILLDNMPVSMLKAAVAKSQEVVAAAEKKAAEMTSALEAARKAADEKAAAVKPVEDKLAASKAAADAAKAEIEKAKAALETPVNLATAQSEPGKN